MAYNTSPYGYNGSFPFYNNQTPNQSLYQQQTVQEIYVKGIEEAKAYPLGPGAEVTLWDATQPSFYKVTSNGLGKPNTVRIFNYVEEIISSENQNSINSELSELIKRFDKLEEEVNQLTFRQKNKGNNRRDTNAESNV